MGAIETEVEKAEGRVHESQERVARQRQLVLKLESGGFPTVEAREVLSSFEQALRHHEMQLAHLRRTSASAENQKQQHAKGERQRQKG